MGAYGIDASIHPGNGLPLQGPPTNTATSPAMLQYQFIGEDQFSRCCRPISHEKQTLDASFADMLAANDDNTLDTFKLAGEYSYQRTIGGSLGVLQHHRQQRCRCLYAQAPVVGSANNSPDSRGYIAEINYLPFLNTKLQLQYTVYDKFNGLGTNYDGAGRNASDNNTLYLLAWVNF